MCVASVDLLCYLAQSVCTWPSTNRDQLLAVAHQDLHVARQNVADLTRYLDIQAAHLAACAGAGDEDIPLMTVEMFPRLPGGVRAALDSLQ